MDSFWGTSGNEPAIEIVLVGIGGYGEVYLSALLDYAGENGTARSFRIAGAVDPDPASCSRFDELKNLDVPIFSSLLEFYNEKKADLAVISSPIQLHREHACLALEKGSHVLCEKPAAATIDDVDAMLECERKSNRWVAIGYQWSFSPTIQELKKDIQEGLFGFPLKVKCFGLWPRDETYYKRNHWAGRIRDDEGRWILDSPLNNAMAHDMHNMLYLLGNEMNNSVSPTAVTAELYRANKIENFDTAALRVETEGGVDLLFYASHAVSENQDPIFSCSFSDAIVAFDGGTSPVKVQFHDGREKEYPSPNDAPQWTKLWDCLRACSGEIGIPCGLQAARAQTQVVGGAAESSPIVAIFPEEIIQLTGGPGEKLIWVDGLPEALREAYQKELLPSEINVQWARTGRRVPLR